MSNSSNGGTPATNPAYTPQYHHEEVPQGQAPPQQQHAGDPQDLAPHTKRQLSGAAVAGGVAGLLVGGPIVGALAAGGAALAVTSKSKTGDVARAGGDAVAATGDRLKRINKKHKITERTGKGIMKGCKWVEKRMTPKNSHQQQQQQQGFAASPGQSNATYHRQSPSGSAPPSAAA